MSLFYASCILAGLAYWYTRYSLVRYRDVYKDCESEDEYDENPKPFNMLNPDPPTIFFEELLPWGPWISDLQEYPYISYRYTRNGRECMIVKTTGLAWGGYVKVQGLTDEQLSSLREIHEGMNTGDYEGWIGFSCNQPEDLSPFPGGDETRRYWTFYEVFEKTNRMAMILSSVPFQESLLSSS